MAHFNEGDKAPKGRAASIHRRLSRTEGRFLVCFGRNARGAGEGEVSWVAGARFRRARWHAAPLATACNGMIRVRGGQRRRMELRQVPVQVPRHRRMTCPSRAAGSGVGGRVCGWDRGCVSGGCNRLYDASHSSPASATSWEPNSLLRSQRRLHVSLDSIYLAVWTMRGPRIFTPPRSVALTRRRFA